MNYEFDKLDTSMLAKLPSSSPSEDSFDLAIVLFMIGVFGTLGTIGITDYLGMGKIMYST